MISSKRHPEHAAGHSFLHNLIILTCLVLLASLNVHLGASKSELKKDLLENGKWKMELTPTASPPQSRESNVNQVEFVFLAIQKQCTVTLQIPNTPSGPHRSFPNCTTALLLVFWHSMANLCARCTRPGTGHGCRLRQECGA